jgi:hypothetical protein
MRIVSFLFLGIAGASTAQAGQQTTSRPASQVIEQTGSGRSSWRLQRTTTQMSGGETTTETEQMPDLDGRMVPVRETVVEVIRGGRVVRTNSETFGFAMSGQRRLLETRELVESSTAGRVQATDTTWRSDLNGRLAISERITEDTSVTPDTRRTERTIHRPDPDGRLRPMERTDYAERQASPQRVRATITESQVDVNNRWQVIEIRNRDVRGTGVTEEAEETILLRDLNGALSERSRIRRTTSPSADGGREVVEEVEERNPVAPADPIRMVRRIVETTSRTGSGRWETERQVFERDANNRLVLTSSETEVTTER